MYLEGPRNYCKASLYASATIAIDLQQPVDGLGLEAGRLGHTERLPRVVSPDRPSSRSGIADGVQLIDRLLRQRQVGRREVFAKMDQR
jgi:hypothetical protein